MGVGEALVKVGQRLGLLEMVAQPQRADPALSFDTWLSYLQYAGLNYPFVLSQSLGQKQEWPAGTFESFVQGIYKRDGVVFATMLTRQLVFSEARFQYRQRVNGRPGDLFGTPDLDILENPWPGGTTGDLLGRMIQDADLAGNSFTARRGKTLFRLRPDWVSIVLGSNDSPDTPWEAMDATVAGYLYQPGGGLPRETAKFLTPKQVAHFAPVPDPSFRFRGMSWLTPVLPESLGDMAASAHKLQFFENGATPNLTVTMGQDMTEDEFKLWVKIMTEKHEGLANAYKTLWLTKGAQPNVIGANMRQIDFKATQGAGETRIAAAGGVPPVIVGLSEGLAASTYSNYGQARRRLSDGTMRPLWRNAAGSLANIITVPANSELWYDDRDIPFLKEDLKDTVDIMAVEAQAIKTFIDAGFEPETVVAAVRARDFDRLKHSKMYSVQLQPPSAPAIKALVDAGFDPASVVDAITSVDFKKLVFKEKPPPPAALPPGPPPPPQLPPAQ